LNVGWTRFLIERNYSGNHPWSVHYFGWIGLTLAIMGSVSALRRRNRWGITFVVLIVVGFVGMIFLSRLRILNFFVLPFALLAGIGADWVIRGISLWGDSTRRIQAGFISTSCFAILVLIDQVSLLPRGQYSALPTVGYFESPETLKSLDRIRNEEGVFGRTLQIRSSLEASSWSDLEPVVSGFPTLSGGNHETAPRSWPYTAAFIDGLVKGIYTDEGSDLPLEDLCLLFGVRFLAYPSEATGRLDFGNPIPSGDRYHCLEADRYSPVIASATYTIHKETSPLDRLPGSLSWRSNFIMTSPLSEIVGNYGLDEESFLCEQLLFREIPNLSITNQAEPPLEFRFEKERVSHTQVRMEFESSRSCYLRLAYPHDPRLQVRLDGRIVETVPTAMHLTGLVCPSAGKHHLEIRAVYLPIEKLGWGLSLISWLGSLIFLAWSSIKRT
jgi:hypothetical protein